MRRIFRTNVFILSAASAIGLGLIGGHAWAQAPSPAAPVVAAPAPARTSAPVEPAAPANGPWAGYRPATAWTRYAPAPSWSSYAANIGRGPTPSQRQEHGTGRPVALYKPWLSRSR